MVKVRMDKDEGQNEVEVLGGDSEVISTDVVPHRHHMLRRGLLGEEEEKILQEYMQRSDTAVIFPEPVEQGTWRLTHCTVLCVMKPRFCIHFHRYTSLSWQHIRAL
jgi:hypothetical protein